MNKEQFLVFARKRLRASFSSYKDAAEYMGMKPSRLSLILSGKVDTIPKELLITVGCEIVEAQYRSKRG
jgi:hypothetical protein